MSAAYVPPFRRPGYQPSTPAPPPRDPPAVRYLRYSSWTHGAGPNYYYPANHPHIHLFLSGAGWNMAYSAGQQHRGGRGVLMVQNGVQLRNYAWGIRQLQGVEGFDRDVVDRALAAMASW